MLTHRDDPFQQPVEDCVVYESDAVVFMEDGKVAGFGPAETMLQTLPDGMRVVEYKDDLIVPSFIDCHVHYPQTEIIGAYQRPRHGISP